MKNIKIIPLYYKTYNYGGMLQIYAMYTAVDKIARNININCYVVNADDAAKVLFARRTLYNNHVLKKPSFQERVTGKIKRTIAKLRYGDFKNKFSLRNQSFDDFRKNKLKTVTLDYTDIDSFNTDTTLYIAGSDQIWNPGFACDVHFLEFASVRNKKMTYAASIGMQSLPDFIINRYKDLLRDFDYISVREKDAEEIAIKELNISDSVLVADPVFLLNRTEWQNLIMNRVCKYDNFAFCYFIGYNKNTRVIAKEIARQYGKEIVSIPYINQRYIPLEEMSHGLLYDAAPEDFLLYINRSDLVMTDSFHAMAFSIIMHKEFVVLECDPGRTGMLSRIHTLLDSVGLSDRLINSEGDLVNLKPIEWDDVEKKMQPFIEFSLKWLTSCINDACNG